MILPECKMAIDGVDACLVDNIARVKYPNHLTPEVTIRMYKWFFELAVAVGINSIHGGVFDFTEVERFHPQNLRTARMESKKINEKFDLSRFPNAFLVRNMHQEQMLRVSMRLTQNSERLRVVHSEESALQYIREWHKTHKPDSVE